MKDARLIEAIQYHKQGRLPEAETLYRELLATDPDNADANHNLGDIAFRTGQIEQAVVLLQKALVGDPQNPRNWESLANVLTEAGYPDDALKVLQEGRQLGILRAPEAAPKPAATPHGVASPNTAENQAEEQLPKGVRQQLASAVGLFQSGKTAQALQMLRTLTRRHPENGWLLKRYGQLLGQSGRHQNAIQALMSATKRLPEDAEVLLHLANSLQHTGELRDAERTCAKGLLIEPENGLLHSMMSSILHRLHQDHDAIHHARRALEIDPEHAEAMNNLANALRAVKQTDKAREFYVQALKRKPEYFAAYVNLGNLYRDEGDLLQAEALYAAGLKLRPDDTKTLHNLGTIFKDTRRPEKALEYYRRAAKLAPHALEHADALSEYMRFSDPDDPMIQQLRKAIESDQITERDKAFGMFVLGKAMLDLGRPDEAFEFYRQANEAMYPHAEPNPSYEPLLRLYKEFFTDGIRHRTARFGLDAVPQVLVVGFSRSGKSLVESLIEAHPNAIAEGEKRRLLDFSQRKLADEKGRLSLRYLDSITLSQSQADAQEYLEQIPSDNMLRVNTLPGNNYMLGLLALWLPKVPIIFCYRDLMDLGIASYFKRYEKGNRHTYRLDELGQNIRVYEEFMRLWMEVLPNPKLEVHYEELVRSPEVEAQRIYEFLGLEWKAEYLAHLDAHKDLAAHIGPAHSLEAPAPIRADFVGTATPFLEHLAPLREGYEAAGRRLELDPAAPESDSQEVLIESAAQERVQTTIGALVENLEKLLAMRNPYAADHLASKILKQHPAMGTIKRLRAEALSQIGHDSVALELLESLVARNPEQPENHEALTWAFLRAKQWDEAARALSRHPQPGSVSAQILRVTLAAWRGDPDAEARQMAQDLLQDNPDDARLHSWLAALSPAAEAQPLHERALALAPDDPEVVWRHAMTLTGDARRTALWRACQCRPMTRMAKQAYADLRKALPVDLADLHSRIEAIWASYRDDELEVAFGDYGLPYQAFEPLYLPGTRPSIQRLDTYRIRHHLAPGGRALDIGCNHGYLLLGLADHLSQGEGFEISRACVEIGQTAAAHLGKHHIQLRQQTFEDFLKEKPERFNLVIACAVHRWIKMPLEKFGEILRELTLPDGIVLVESQGVRSPDRVEPDFGAKLNELCRSGFERVEEGTLCDDGLNKREFALLRRL